MYSESDLLLCSKTLYESFFNVPTDISEDTKLFYEEAFAPVVTVKRYKSIDEALEQIGLVAKLGTMQRL
ncbi:MAG TPA: hypothetical protein EYP08_00805 [Pyrodictiaceae archaeon]|nr:hypothetical protein [Pyrodictiaceae archaeon]